MSTTLDSVPDYLPTNGRPRLNLDAPHPVYDESIGAAIISQLYKGATIHQACEYSGIAPETLAKWRVEHNDYAQRFAQALEAYHDQKADSLLSAHEDIEDPQRARLYSDNVKWLLSKRDKRYSERLELNVEHRVSLADALKEANGRLLSTSYQVIPDPAETLIASDSQASRPSDSQSDSGASELDALLS